jgi:hypothetical protein
MRTSTEYHSVVYVCLQEDLRATSRKGYYVRLPVPVNLSGACGPSETGTASLQLTCTLLSPKSYCGALHWVAFYTN